MDLSISRMMRMQQELQEKEYQAAAGGGVVSATVNGKHELKAMVEEVGEAIAVVKKKGSQAIMEDPKVRTAFLEEMADILMYCSDVLLRYYVTPEEISEAYVRKHHRNMGRDYTREYEELYYNG